MLPIITTKVVIIGAGVAGLSAANRLVQKGFDRSQVVVLEAQSRVGGRLYTDDSLGFPLDLGAAWVHGITDNPLLKYIDEKKELVQTSPDNWWLSTDPALASETLHVGNKVVSAAQSAEGRKLFERILREVQAEALNTKDAHNMSVMDVLRSKIEAHKPSAVEWQLINWYILKQCLWHGGALRDVTLKMYGDLEEEWGDFDGGHCVVAPGFERTLVQRMVPGLNIHTNREVIRIDYTHPTWVLIVTRDRSTGLICRYRCRAVIVTVSLGVLQHKLLGMHHLFTGPAANKNLTPLSNVVFDFSGASVLSEPEDLGDDRENNPLLTLSATAGASRHNSVIRTITAQLPKTVNFADKEFFVPALPSSFMHALSCIAMGVYKKVALLFDAPFWESTNPFIGNIERAGDEFAAFLDYNFIKGKPALVAFATGDVANRMELLPDPQVVKEVLAVLNRMYPGKVTPVKRFVVTNWSRNPFTFGAYSFTTLGGTTGDIYELRKPISNNRVFFAGEACSVAGQACVHGAHESAIVQADRVYDAYFQPSSVPQVKQQVASQSSDLNGRFHPVPPVQTLPRFDASDDMVNATYPGFVPTFSTADMLPSKL